jgi:phage shock protein C
MHVQIGERGLRRPRRGAMVSGVAAGLGAYLGVDPFLVRFALVVATLAGGLGALAYLVLALSMPRVEEEPAAEPESRGPRPPFRPLAGVPAAGIFFIGFGLLALLVELEVVAWLTWATAWPFLVILLGAALLVARER